MGYHPPRGEPVHWFPGLLIILVLLGLFIYGLTVHVIPFITTLESQ